MRLTRPALAALLTLALATACGGSDDSTVLAPPSPTPSATAAADSSAPCTPSGTGTTDLAKKPVPVVPKTPAPAETTSTDVVCGTGKQAEQGSDVTVKYVGVLYADGKQFDASWDRSPDTFDFQVGGAVVPGFSKGVLGMKEGGRRQVVIPSKDGYGDQGAGPIPPGATLVFVIDLVKVG